MPTLADQIAPKPQQPSGLGGWLASIGDEMAGAFARYGRRSGAQRDASLEMLNQASAPGTDPIMGAGQKLLGLAGLITHPLAFFPTREEWDQRLQAAGNDGRMSRSIGGFLSDLPSLIDPQMAAGGAALAAAPIVGKLGRGISDLAGDATDAELAALRARLQAEAAQTGGAANTATRDEALQNLVGEPQRKQLVTQSYKETLPDGTTRWVPGTLRANPTTGPRFEPDMSIADIRRYIEQFGEPPPPRAKGEIVTGKRKDVYQDGTVTPVPGLLRTKRPASLGEALQATAPLAAKMLNKADDVADAGITAYHASPYKFDKFSMQHMGTGHGKQQEGAGLYFTDDSLLADEYWKNHAGKSPEAIAEKFATNWGPEAASKLEQFAARRSQEMRPEAVKPLYDALEMLRSGADTSSKGARYMVRISAAGDEILDLTKGGKVPVEIGDPLKLTPETAKKNGIKVLAYKAGVESSNPSAKNYVVFDESIITILKKYGIPMTAGAGGAMMVAGQDMPPELASQMGGT